MVARCALIAPNAFKGTLTAGEAAAAIRCGVRRARPDWETSVFPMADGGSGTLDALLALHGGERRRARVRGPLGEPVDAAWATLGDGRTAVVEMAQSSGLRHVAPEARNPLYATSFGTGELLRCAVASGAQKIILGLGDTATVDGGAGMLQALGVRLADAAGAELDFGGAPLERLANADAAAALQIFDGVDVVIACDVKNPLLGENGAARVFGPQKGAAAADVPRLESGLARLADVLEAATGVAYRDFPGAGAAGGAGGALVALCGAKMISGASLIVESEAFQREIRRAALVVVGEGRLDAQTLAGKGPLVVARAARRAGVPVVAFAGSVALTEVEWRNAGFADVRVAPASAETSPARSLEAAACAYCLESPCGRRTQ
jgi:glycerate 2-kinase